MLCIVIFYILIIKFARNTDQEDLDIAIIAQSKYGYAWELIYDGARAAGNEYGADIQIFAPDYEKDIEAQRVLVEMAITNEVDAILIAPIDYEAIESTLLDAMDKNIAVMSMMIPHAGDQTMGYIGTNHLQSGEIMANLILNHIGYSGKVGLIIDRDLDILERKEGLLKVFAEFPNIQTITIENALSDELSAARITKTMMDYNKDLDAIIGLNQVITTGICKAMEKESIKIPIYGFDYSEAVINYMDSGLINTQLVQNHFGIGYKASSVMIQQLKGKNNQTYSYIDTMILTPENMYDELMQKVIFHIE